MKKALLFLLALIPAVLFAANHDTDSLKKQLSISSNTENIEILLELANQYSSSNFDSALFYCNHAINLASELHKPIKQAQAIKTKGNIFFRKGELDKTLEQYNKAIEIFLNSNKMIEAAKIYNNKGLLYMNWGNNTDALCNLEKAIKIYNESENNLLTTGPLINMGLLYFRTGNYKDAEQSFKKALNIAESNNELHIATNATNNLGAVYNEWGRYNDALDYYYKSIENFKIVNDKYGESIAYYNIGVVYEELGSYSKAIDFVHKSLDLKKEINSTTKIPVSLNKMGNIYCQWEKYELALNYYADAMSIAKENKNKLEIANALSGMAQVYSETDIYNKSLDYFKEALFLYEEINSKKEIAQINNEIGEIYAEKLKQYVTAEEYYDIAQQLFLQIESNSGLSNLYLSKGKLNYAQNSFSVAIKYIKKSIELAPHNSYKMLNNYLLLAQCYSQQKSFEDAMSAYQLALAYKDSVIKDKTTLQSAQFEVHYQTEKKEQEIENLMRQSELNTLLLNKKKDMQILLITIIVLLIAIIGLALFFYRRLKEVNANLIKKQVKIETHKKELEVKNDQLQKANIKAERLSQFKSQFLANISHEIRTPLNAITGYAKLLSKNLKIDSNNYYVNQVLQSTDNMMVIISDLLDFSKIEAGKMVLESLNFNPVKIITHAISTLKFKAESKNIQLEIHIDPFIPKTIIGDPHRLSQILINLINNAIKFSNEGQIVTIESKCENHGDDCLMQFSISDKGLGIAENKLETIFESFTQVNSDTSRLYEGTGLGLSIVKRLVELQKGNISVKSKVKEGSVFEFSISYKIAPNSRKSKEIINTEKSESQLSENYNILLVEDNIINQELAKDTIKSWTEPFSVDVAENGKEAIIALQQKKYNLVLMDIQMPVMDGHEATQYIRSSLPAPICNIPIIGMTAHAMSSEKEIALKNGMNEYIIKPFNPDELKQKIIFFVTLKE